MESELEFDMESEMASEMANEMASEMESEMTKGMASEMQNELESEKVNELELESLMPSTQVDCHHTHHEYHPPLHADDVCYVLQHVHVFPIIVFHAPPYVLQLAIVVFGVRC
jgi:hypothetical protein